VKRLWDDDELTAEWTLEPNDQSLLANKTGATRLGFAALLAVFRHEGRFPASKRDVPATVVAHLARQVGVPAEAYVAYDWHGRTSITASRFAPPSVSVRRVLPIPTSSLTGSPLRWCPTTAPWIVCSGRICALP
jgi:hypothetical protein